MVAHWIVCLLFKCLNVIGPWTSVRGIQAWYDRELNNCRTSTIIQAEKNLVSPLFLQPFFIMTGSSQLDSTMLCCFSDHVTSCPNSQHEGYVMGKPKQKLYICCIMHELVTLCLPVHHPSQGVLFSESISTCWIRKIWILQMLRFITI